MAKKLARSPALGPVVLLGGGLLIENASAWFFGLKAAVRAPSHFRSRLTTTQPSARLGNRKKPSDHGHPAVQLGYCHLSSSFEGLFSES
jgi:hypothetical protein